MHGFCIPGTVRCGYVSLRWNKSSQQQTVIQLPKDSLQRSLPVPQCCSDLRSTLVVSSCAQKLLNAEAAFMGGFLWQSKGLYVVRVL